MAGPTSPITSPLVLPVAPVAEWLTGLLAATGYPVSYAVAPKVTDRTQPYLVHTPIPGGQPDGGPFAADLYAVGWLVWQVDAVVWRADQAPRAADAVNAVMLDVGQFPGPDQVGFAVIARDLDGGWDQQPIRGDAPPGQQIWTVPQRYRLYVALTEGEST